MPRSLSPVLGGPIAGRRVAERRKKLRGGRRYFRKLPDWPQSVRVQLGGSSWYDLWHTHPDFYGWSLRSGRAHRAHLEVLFAAFRRVVGELASSNEPGQVFVTVNSRDTAGDALYVHTPNPNADNFPFQFPGYSWSEEVPSLLAPFVDRVSSEVGWTTFNGEGCYVVAPKGPRGRPTRG